MGEGTRAKGEGDQGAGTLNHCAHITGERTEATCALKGALHAPLASLADGTPVKVRQLSAKAPKPP